MDERVQWALTKAALWNETKDKLHQSGYSLSGGQQQRLCLSLIHIYSFSNYSQDAYVE